MAACAAPNGSAAVAILLTHGADVAAENNRERTPLRIAADGGDAATVRLLLARASERDELEEVVRAAGPTVAIAASNGFHEIVELLLEHGADPNRANGSRGSGLNRALMAGDTDTARSLILHGARLNGRSQPDDTPTAVLSAYTERDDPSIVELLQERDVDFNEANRDGQTALTWARMRGHPQLIDALVEAGAAEGEMPARPEIPSRSIDVDGGNLARLITESVQKSVDLLQLSSDTFLDVRNNCVSCHHQNLPGVALAWARDRGFPVRQATLERMLERQVRSWAPRIERAYEMDEPFPVPPRFLGWGMWSFSELGYRPDELTRAVSWYLVTTQQPDGRWAPGMLRPPLGGNGIVATMLVARTRSPRASTALGAGFRTPRH
jgi:ankyrin repeat protein